MNCQKSKPLEILDKDGNSHSLVLFKVKEWNFFLDGKYYKKTFKTQSEVIEHCKSLIP